MPNFPLRFVVGGVTYTAIDPRLGVDPNLGAVNVKTMGAAGNGTTDDTAAIQRAVDALDPVRGGTVWFPPGKYKPTSTIFTNGRPVLFRGSGMGDHLSTGDHGSASSSGGTWDMARQGSAIVTDSATLNTFLLDAPGSSFEDLSIVNYRYAEPTAGAGIRVTAGNAFHMNRVRVSGFYDNLSLEQSEYSTLTSCSIQDAVRHGIYARNLYHVDQGDMSVLGSVFGFSGFRGSDGAAGAAIRLESGGGLRFVSSKINQGPPPSAAKWTRGIDIQISGGVTGVFLVTGSSLENVTDPIRVVGGLNNISITGNQMSGVTNAVYINGVSNVTVTGNVFTDATKGVELVSVQNAIVGANLGGSFIKGAGCTNIREITTAVV